MTAFPLSNVSMLSWLVSWLKICQKQSPDHPGSKIRYQAIGVIDQTLTRCFRAFNWRLCWKRRERERERSRAEILPKVGVHREGKIPFLDPSILWWKITTSSTFREHRKCFIPQVVLPTPNYPSPQLQCWIRAPVCKTFLSSSSIHYSLGRQVVKKVLWNVFWEFHRPLGCSAAAVLPKQARGTLRTHFMLCVIESFVWCVHCTIH